MSKSDIAYNKLQALKAKCGKVEEEFKAISVNFMSICYKIFDFQIKTDPNDTKLHDFKNKFALLHKANDRDYIIQAIGPRLEANKAEIMSLDKDKFNDIEKITQQAESIMQEKKVKEKIKNRAAEVIDYIFSKYNTLEERDREVIHGYLKTLVDLYDKYTTYMACIRLYNKKMDALRSDL